MVSVNKIVGKVVDACAGKIYSVHINAPVSDEITKSGGEISKDYSKAATSYGKAVVRKLEDKFNPDGTLDVDFGIQRIKKLFSKVRPNSTMSLEEAVKEINVLNIPEDDKIKLLQACIFDLEKGEMVISSPAVYMAKYAVMDGAGVKNLPGIIRTSLIEDAMIFSDDIFYSAFKGDSWRFNTKFNIKPNATGGDKMALVHMEHKSHIYEALQKLQTKLANSAVKVKAKDIFDPLEDISKGIMTRLEELVANGEELPKGLMSDFKKALSEFNYDLRQVYRDYYGLLKDCKTLDEVKKLYPELKFPEVKPSFLEGVTNTSLNNRLCNSDFESAVIEGLQKLYLDMFPKTRAFVHIENSTATNVKNLERAGFNFSSPSDALLEVFRDCESRIAILNKISKMSDAAFEPHVQKHALRTSKTWTDFANLTSTPEWMGIRLIKNKKYFPDTTRYTTKNLVDTYLYSLFIRNPYQRYAANPLAKFNGINELDPNMKYVVSRTYYDKMLSKEDFTPVNMSPEYWEKVSKEFSEFKKQFDLKAIGESFEHMERVYHKAFYRSYWNEERILALQKQLQNSYDLVYEKVLWGEETRARKIVSKNEVEKIIERSEGSAASDTAVKLIDESAFNTYKHNINKIQNLQLKDRFLAVIAGGRSSDVEYFKVYENIINSALNKEGLINETKAEALLNLHDKYLSDVMAGASEISEAEYISNILSKYKLTDGSYDFARVVSDTNAEIIYSNLAGKLMKQGDSTFIAELERRYGYDYAGLNRVIDTYMKIPQKFRDKYRTIFLNSSKNCPNVVLERESEDFYSKIDSWHFGKDEYIQMEDVSFNQKIVITKEAKEALWKETGENFETFDQLISKLYSSGKKRTGDRKGTGIKTYQGGEHEVEIKILGRGGSYRLYADKMTPQDKEKYGHDVKYVFKIVGQH